MKSEWKVTSNSINGSKMYGVYRQLDINAVDHSGNREYHGGYTLDRNEAQMIVDDMNQKEKEPAPTAIGTSSTN